MFLPAGRHFKGLPFNWNVMKTQWKPAWREDKRKSLLGLAGDPHLQHLKANQVFLVSDSNCCLNLWVNFHHRVIPNYTNKATGREVSTGIGKLVIFPPQSSCYKISYTVSRTPLPFPLRSCPGIHSHQTWGWKPLCLWTFVILSDETPR